MTDFPSKRAIHDYQERPSGSCEALRAAYRIDEDAIRHDERWEIVKALRMLARDHHHYGEVDVAEVVEGIANKLSKGTL